MLSIWIGGLFVFPAARYEISPNAPLREIEQDQLQIRYIIKDVVMIRVTEVCGILRLVRMLPQSA